MHVSILSLCSRLPFFLPYAVCFFLLVLRCSPKLQAPAGGGSLCTKGNQYGSKCSFACHIGHKMIGSALRVCEKDPVTSLGFWTGNETKCDCKSNSKVIFLSVRFNPFPHPKKMATFLKWSEHFFSTT